MVEVKQVVRQWSKLSLIVNTSSLRERVLVLGMINTIIIISIFHFYIDPSNLSVKALSSEYSHLTIKRTINDANFKILKFERSIDPNKKIQENIAEIKNKIQNKDQLIYGKSTEFVSAKQMVNLLIELLENQEGIELLSLKNIPVSPMLWGTDQSRDDSNLAKEINEIIIFRHGVRITFKGDYNKLIKYIKQIESMNWHFFWNVIRVEMRKNNKATVTLELSTVGFDRDWIGG